ncbi:Uncharacterised protein [Mycobacterium tuberculosis]|uniref:Uncharacterized protein n=1 Tax=Mycobacterium tuberculosis TaxID=1773 RepID=A0A654TIG6_MYCTX|nr:Uncharacterised protein [Mycobacterium tuberculosis]COW36390.1 Uncharacterised protein [Mycobacterium tuberculosis]
MHEPAHTFIGQNAGQERLPERRFGVGLVGTAAYLCDAVSGRVGPQFERVQVQRPIRDVEQVRVAVEVGYRRGEWYQCGGQVEHAGHAGRRFAFSDVGA